MNRVFRRWCAATAAIAAFLILAGCGSMASFLPGRADNLEIFEGESPVEVHKLDNGMTVLIKESHANPIVTLDVWVNTGSINEPPAISGASHFLEHMLFKGTEKRAVGEIDREIDSVGGEMNAATGRDYTHYYVTVASDYVSTGLDVLSDLIMNSTLDPDEMESERQVILEEYRRKQDSPFGYLFDEIYDVAYRSGPYKQSIIGTTASLTTMTRAQLMEYYRRYYTPDNMALVVAGDVEPETILPEIETYFGQVEREKEPFDENGSRVRRAGRTIRITSKDLRDTYSVMAFPAPSIKQPFETVVMDVLAVILGEGRSSRLYQSLREDKQLVSGIEASYPTPKKPGLVFIVATLEAEDIDDMRLAVIDELQRLRKRRVSRRELAKAKKMLLNAHYFATETTTGQTQVLGAFYTLSGGPEFEARYLRYIQQVSAKDVQRVARKYFDPEKMIMVSLKPNEESAITAGGR